MWKRRPVHLHLTLRVTINYSAVKVDSVEKISKNAYTYIFSTQRIHAIDILPATHRPITSLFPPAPHREFHLCMSSVKLTRHVRTLAQQNKTSLTLRSHEWIRSGELTLSIAVPVTTQAQAQSSYPHFRLFLIMNDDISFRELAFTVPFSRPL